MSSYLLVPVNVTIFQLKLVHCENIPESFTVAVASIFDISSTWIVIEYFEQEESSCSVSFYIIPDTNYEHDIARGIYFDMYAKYYSFGGF